MEVLISVTGEEQPTVGEKPEPGVVVGGDFPFGAVGGLSWIQSSAHVGLVGAGC